MSDKSSKSLELQIYILMDRHKLMLYVLMYCKYCHFIISICTRVMDRLTHIETNIVLNEYKYYNL